MHIQEIKNTLDAPHRKGEFKKELRSVAENIVPNSAGVTKAIGLVCLT